MSTSYEPELGQIAFGHPPLELACPDHVEKALEKLRDRWDTLRPNDPNPFSNSGSRYGCEGLDIHSYSWGDDNQTWNFKWQDVEVSWYKYLGRGMSINQEVSEQRSQQMLSSCLPLIEKLVAVS